MCNGKNWQAFPVAPLTGTDSTVLTEVLQPFACNLQLFCGFFCVLSNISAFGILLCALKKIETVLKVIMGVYR